MDINKALAEIAIAGIFEGMQKEASVIIDALLEEPICERTKISLRALQLMSSEKYTTAVDVLEPWCTQNDDTLDTPHGFLALSLWRAGNLGQSKQWCDRLMKDCRDPSTRSLANDVLAELGA